VRSQCTDRSENAAFLLRFSLAAPPRWALMPAAQCVRPRRRVSPGGIWLLCVVGVGPKAVAQLRRCLITCSATTASVWARNHFQIVAVRVGKVDPASTVVMIDLARAAMPRIGPVLDTLLLDATEDSIEIGLGNQECVVLRLDGSIGSREIERHSVVELDPSSRSIRRRSW
jgi:hypothetical protein